jgi:DNA sulfur modification protein DndE
MLPSRYRISIRATRVLTNLRAPTGLTPNVLCRVALLFSLQHGKEGGLKHLKLDGSEFNAPTLFGEHALAYEVILRSLHGDLPPRRMVEVVASHIEDGVDQLRGYAPVWALMLGMSKRADKFNSVPATLNASEQISA